MSLDIPFYRTFPVGAVSERVTVEADAPLIDTESPWVSTVVNRQFAENLPLNGRSFQTPHSAHARGCLDGVQRDGGGQFSVNGQHAASNYWMVDGVSANVGIGSSGSPAGNGISGANTAYRVRGGTNSLLPRLGQWRPTLLAISNVATGVCSLIE